MPLNWFTVSGGILLFFCSLLVLPQTATSCNTEAIEPEEIFLELRVDNTLAFDLDGYICKDKLYIPIGELLSHLKSDYEISQNGRQIEARFRDKDHTYRINLTDHQAHLPEERISFPESHVIRPGEQQESYLHIELLERIFNFSLHFIYRDLRVLLYSDFELPVIANYERIESYRYFRPPAEQPEPDRSHDPSRYLLKGGFLDWRINSSHSPSRQNYSYGASMGTQFLGGNLFLSSSGSVTNGVNTENLRGRWEFPVYSTPLLRQINVGDQSHDNLFGRGTQQYQGVELTNRPNSSRYHFSEFTVSEPLPDGWDAELHVNNQMIGLARSNETDSISFREPIRYGSNRYTLRYYSPDGFSHEDTRRITVPRYFLSPGDLEYSLSAGQHRYSTEEFARAHIMMGLTSSITLGGGYYLLTEDRKTIDHHTFVQTAVRLGSRLWFEGTHTLDHMSEGSLLFYYFNNRSVRINARKFHDASQFRISNRTFEGSMNTSLPISLGSLQLSTSINARYTEFEKNSNLNLSAGFSSSLPFGMQLRLRSQNTFHSDQTEGFELFRSEVSTTVSRRMLGRVLIRPQVTYDYTNARVNEYRFQASSRIFRNGNFSLSARYNPRHEQHSVMATFRYDLPSARHQSQIRTTNSRNPTYSQRTSGNFGWDRDAGTMHTGSRSRTGDAVLRLDPFLISGTDEHQSLEEITGQLDITLYRNGREQSVRKDGDLIINLIPYEKYIVQVHADNLNNPLWRLQAETFQIQVLPNMVNTLPVSVIAVGEVTGRIIFADVMDDPGISLRGLRVVLEKKDDGFSETVTTVSSGRFFYVGLEPGDYQAYLDPDQLRSLDLEVRQDSISFVVEPTEQGDIVDGLNFEIFPAGPEALVGRYMMQLGAFRMDANARECVRLVENITSREIVVRFDPEDELYRCILPDFPDSGQASQFLHNLREVAEFPFYDGFVIPQEF